ncbi:hypothetical protein VP01_11379g1, partial [Puccinia sorghi]
MCTLKSTSAILLGHSISQQSLNCWLALYQETCAMLVHNQPGLFLSKICEQTHDSQGFLLSLPATHNNLVNLLLITFKKADTVNISKCLHCKKNLLNCL